MGGRPRDRSHLRNRIASDAAAHALISGKPAFDEVGRITLLVGPPCMGTRVAGHADGARRALRDRLYPPVERLCARPVAGAAKTACVCGCGGERQEGGSENEERGNRGKPSHGRTLWHETLKPRGSISKRGYRRSLIWPSSLPVLPSLSPRRDRYRHLNRSFRYYRCIRTDLTGRNPTPGDEKLGVNPNR